MKTIRHLATLAFLLLALPNWCFALMSIENVTPEWAQELGLEIRTIESGPGNVRMELEFEVQKLPGYERVDLILGQGERLLHATLKEDVSKPGFIVVGFAADRSHLDQLTLRVVTRQGVRSMTGHDILTRDFVDEQRDR